jgi:hypothetical protein
MIDKMLVLVQAFFYKNHGLGVYCMKRIGIILIAIGGVGIILGGMMFGDIGIAAFIGATTALVSGIGFLKLTKLLQKPTNET